MATTFVKIQTVTVGSGGAATIDFTSIPQTYTDLKLVISSRVSYATSGDTPYLDFNGLTTNRTGRFLEGSGAAAASSTLTRQGFVASGTNAATNAFGSTEIYIPNYTSTTTNKSFSVDSVTENNGTTAYQWLVASLWSSTAAITRVTLTPTSGSFVEYSTATLYGISNVTASNTSYATGGNMIYTDGTYWYHQFQTVGTTAFVPTRNLTVDYLVVAGGGGGGRYGGGGGAGGYRTTVGTSGGGGASESPLSLTANTSYTVTVGSGGAGWVGDAQSGGNAGSGTNSVFGSITSTGGGGGGNYGNPSYSVGLAGGSSGGGGALNGSPNPIASGSPVANQGYIGGTGGYQYTTNAAGGGGGAGGAGAAGNAGGQGGVGLSSTISGVATFRGGGGSGSQPTSNLAGGNGGGGTGLIANNTSTAIDGIPNTGGGGGGGRDGLIDGTYRAGNGGSGIVIIRYAV